MVDSARRFQVVDVPDNTRMGADAPCLAEHSAVGKLEFECALE